MRPACPFRGVVRAQSIPASRRRPSRPASRPVRWRARFPPLAHSFRGKTPRAFGVHANRNRSRTPNPFGVIPQTTLGLYPKRVWGKTPKGLGVIPQKHRFKRALSCQVGTMEYFRSGDFATTEGIGKVWKVWEVWKVWKVWEVWEVWGISRGEAAAECGAAGIRALPREGPAAKCGVGGEMLRAAKR